MALVSDQSTGKYGYANEAGKLVITMGKYLRPDYPSDGLFRINKGSRIGYASAVTGEVTIAPQFSCAWPFENGRAKVSFECKQKGYGEHSTWISDHWFYVNKAGVRLNP